MGKPKTLRRLYRLRQKAEARPHRARMLKQIEQIMADIRRVQSLVPIQWMAWPRLLALTTDSIPRLCRTLKLCGIEVGVSESKGGERVFLRRVACQKCGKNPAGFGADLELCEPCFDDLHPNLFTA